MLHWKWWAQDIINKWSSKKCERRSCDIFSLIVMFVKTSFLKIHLKYFDVEWLLLFLQSYWCCEYQIDLHLPYMVGGGGGDNSVADRRWKQSEDDSIQTLLNFKIIAYEWSTTLSIFNNHSSLINSITLDLSWFKLNYSLNFCQKRDIPCFDVVRQ